MWIKWAKQFCLQHGYSSTVTPRHSTTTWTLVRKKCIVLNAPHLNFFFFLMWCKMNEGSKAVHCADVYISFMLVFFQQWTNHLKKKVSCTWLWIMPLPGTLMNMTMQKHIFFFGEDLFTHAFVPAIQWTNICWIPKVLSICRIRWINIFVNGHGCLWLATDIHHSRRYACLVHFLRKNVHELHGCLIPTLCHCTVFLLWYVVL